MTSSSHRFFTPLLRLSLLFLLPLLFLSTCKKDNCPDEPSEPCPCSGDACIDQMKAFTYFLPGTWWVYEEQTSGDRDSVYVYEASSSIGSDGSNHFIMRAHSTYDEYNYYYQFTESLQTFSKLRPDCRIHQVNRTKTRPGDFVGTDVWFFYPLLQDDYRFVWGGGRISIDTLWLSGQNNVTQVYFDLDNCNSEDYEPAGFHLEPNLGVVRKTQFNQNQVWDLRDFNIVQ